LIGRGIRLPCSEEAVYRAQCRKETGRGRPLTPWLRALLDDRFHDSDHTSPYLEASKACTPLGDRYMGFYRHMIRILETLIYIDTAAVLVSIAMGST
jgi:hypothetical protein